MVRVPGSSGDSGFHRESLSEDVKIKIEPGMEASAEEGSPQTRGNKRYPDHQSFGRGFDDIKIKEEDRAFDLEEKLPTPPQVPSGTPTDRIIKRDPLDEKITVKSERISSKTTPKLSNKKNSKSA